MCSSQFCSRGHFSDTFIIEIDVQNGTASHMRIDVSAGVTVGIGDAGQLRVSV